MIVRVMQFLPDQRVKSQARIEVHSAAHLPEADSSRVRGIDRFIAPSTLGADKGARTASK